MAHNHRLRPQPCPYCKGALSTLQCPKAACGHCQSFTLPIPPLSWLFRYFPDVKPDMKVDRGTQQNPALTCKLCGLVAAKKKATNAESTSEPARKKKEMERSIAELDSQFIANPETDDDRILQQRQMVEKSLLQRSLRDVKVNIDQISDQAYMDYWGIWGKGEYEIVERRRHRFSY
ncbi:hypothetical protein HYFRA_00009657 [Hymenoscyphus fraxineus]|uniref:Uncharacterized protein n=1 Tax=Hymenoscyphus fraxineus TaxID=746836 RepID=A0A9N9PSI6_9HELO|nr:hypothetical protein HYFRA_00009657 [Hymenoscyphus fraxineus]